MSGFLRDMLLGTLGLIVAIQFIRPARTNPPFDETRTLEAAITVPPAFAAVMARSCADCHSDDTRWPWYSQVAPVSWAVINHVDEGRRHMNFSEWLRPGVNDPVQYTRQKLHSACERVQTHNMPLWSYLLLHPAARLSPEDIKVVCDAALTVGK
jgi:hypothetical protein